MNHLTKCSIYIEMYLTDTADQPLGVGTGFTVKTDQGHSFLVTNWHCVTGINPETNQALSTNEHKDPEFLDAHFLKKNSLNEWAVKRIKLIDEKGKKLYIQHPRGQEIDIVAIKLEDYPDVELYNLWEGNIVDNIDINITESCSVVGFPKGISTGGKFPIWKTGHVASEFELNHDDKPMFLIDASTREGMSGSPVYCVRAGHALVDGKLMSGESTIARFLGIYAGRVGDDIEIGRVFKSNCLNELMINYYNLVNPYRFIPSNLNYNFT